MQTHIINYTQIFGEHLVCQISRQTNGIMFLEWSTVQQPELPSASPFFSVRVGLKQVQFASRSICDVCMS